MRHLESFKVEGKNSMQYWTAIRNPLRVCLNFAVIYTCRFLPSLRLKNALYRLLGIKVGKDVSVGLMAMFDIFFPELIEIGDNTVIGYNTTILAHEYLVDRWRKGRVKIGRDVMIGANCTVLAGVTIGDGAVVSAASLVNRDIAPGAFVGGVPARELQGGDGP
ncbi:MAG: acyltransferase [Euryarchaeota archaeon]|nr:acyltransferase [Euryarchaeota archaeon]